MNVSRRDILRGAAATLLTGASSMAVAPALAASVGGGRGGPAATPGTGGLSRAAFAGQVGTDFHVRLGADQGVDLRLASVSDLAPPPAAAPQPASGREGFSLLFRGPERPAVPQGSHTVDHARIGTFLVFLVPVGPRGSAPSYEAVVNRLWP